MGILSCLIYCHPWGDCNLAFQRGSKVQLVVGLYCHAFLFAESEISKMRVSNSVCNNVDVRICEKYALTVSEAAVYFGIGEKKLRSMISDYSHLGLFIQNGTKYMIKRQKFEDFLNNTTVI